MVGAINLKMSRASMSVECKLRILLTLFCNICIVSSAYAQAIPENVRRDAQRLQERELERLREREQKFKQSQIAPPQNIDDIVDETASADDLNCRKIKAVKLSGVSLYSEAYLLKSAESLVGECTPVTKINALLRSITNQYVGDGYITSRALLSPVQSADDILDILVVEGRLTKVEGISDVGRRYSDAELALTFPALKGKFLNLRDLEQGVDQLARLGSAEPLIDIVAADIPAASNVLVRRKRTGSWIRPSLSFNNDGSASTGRRQVTASLDLDSPFSFADFWSFYYVRDLEKVPGQGAEGYGGFFSLPFGYTTLIASGGRYTFQGILRSNDLAFENTGDSVNGSIGLEHLLYRDQKMKVSVSGTLSFYDTINRIQDIRLSTNSYRTVSADIGVRVQRRVGDGLVLADVGLTRGFAILGANAADIGPGSDGLTFRKIEASLAYQERLSAAGIPFDYSVTIRGQAALDPVLPADRFSIGGSSTVRGFRDDGISGRTGFAFRQQLSFPLFRTFTDKQSNSATQISAIMGYDSAGILPRQGDAFERGYLQSSTLGLRVVNRRLQGEVSVAAPLSAPTTIARQTLEFSASLRLTI
jgi:hemolysin activation/secretion protein